MRIDANQWIKVQVRSFCCCCCTAESQANFGRHQLYNNQKNCPTCAFSTAWLMQLTTTFFVFRPQAQGYSLPDLSTSTPDEILDYIRRHYVLIKTSDGYILGRNTRKRARYLTAQSWEEFDKAKGKWALLHLSTVFPHFLLFLQGVPAGLGSRLGWMDECLLVRYPPLVQIDIADGENEHFSIFFKVEERTLSEHRRVKRASMHSNAVSA